MCVVLLKQPKTGHELHFLMKRIHASLMQNFFLIFIGKLKNLLNKILVYAFTINSIIYIYIYI